MSLNWLLKSLVRSFIFVWMAARALAASWSADKTAALACFTESAFNFPFFSSRSLISFKYRCSIANRVSALAEVKASVIIENCSWVICFAASSLVRNIFWEAVTAFSFSKSSWRNLSTAEIFCFSIASSVSISLDLASTICFWYSDFLADFVALALNCSSNLIRLL